VVKRPERVDPVYVAVTVVSLVLLVLLGFLLF
jgi:hypothetical protein